MGWKDFIKSLGFKEGLIVGTALVAGVALLALLSDISVDTTAPVKLWELMTAIGTVGAVVVALTSNAVARSDSRSIRQAC